jgi:hypothetical protein
VEKEVEGGNLVLRRSCDGCRLDAPPPALLPIARNQVERRDAQKGPTQGRGRHKMWGVSSVRRDYNFLATFFNLQISGLADRFLMEIEENVNLGTEGVRRFVF